MNRFGKNYFICCKSCTKRTKAGVKPACHSFCKEYLSAKAKQDADNLASKKQDYYSRLFLRGGRRDV